MHPSTLPGLVAFAAAATVAPPKRHSNARSSSSVNKFKSHVKNVVILEMDNRSLGNLTSSVVKPSKGLRILSTIAPTVIHRT